MKSVSVTTLLLVLGACAPALRPSAPHGLTVPARANEDSRDVIHNEAAPRSLPRERAVAAGPAISSGLDEESRPEVDGEIATGDEMNFEPTWDIDVRTFESESRVEWWVNRFTGSAKQSFAAQIQRGVPYEPMMRDKLRAAGIPEDMVYLALIESGFDPHAYSRAAAVGMWQFMATTARGVGLRVDWWIDERRDPIRATDGAVKFINELRRQFGSMYLAAAAYNGGPGRVSRGLARYAEDFDGTTGDSLFFALADKDALRAETRDYVPKLIAAAIVAKTPGKFGISIDPMAPFSCDSVRVPGNTSLAAVSRSASVSLDTVRALNPHILRGMTPPGAAMYVRIPTGTADSFAESFKALSESERVATRKHVSRKGETLASIAKKEGKGVSSRTLAWYNPSLVVRRGVLRAGQTVLIPSPEVVKGALDVPDPSIERYGSRVVGKKTHVVKKGESLSTIARDYDVTVAALKKMNGLRGNMIRAGQTLVVRH